MTARPYNPISQSGRYVRTIRAPAYPVGCGMVKDETPTSGEMQPVPLHRAEALTLQGNTAQILLDGQVYTLRITRARKLILTK